MGDIGSHAGNLLRRPGGRALRNLMTCHGTSLCGRMTHRHPASAGTSAPKGEALDLTNKGEGPISSWEGSNKHTALTQPHTYRESYRLTSPNHGVTLILRQPLRGAMHRNHITHKHSRLGGKHSYKTCTLGWLKQSKNGKLGTQAHKSVSCNGSKPLTGTKQR